MIFEWDDNKAYSNLKKHGLSFSDAPFVLQSDCVVTFQDKRQYYSEERYISLGYLMDRLVVIVHTYRYCRVRIISMRKANDREKKIYKERFKPTRSND